jgi:predicted transcriptional regulator
LAAYADSQNTGARAMTENVKPLSSRELKALEDLAKWKMNYPHIAYASQRKKSMEKLQARGFVEPDQVYPKKCYQITQAGMEFLARFPKSNGDAE